MSPPARAAPPRPSACRSTRSSTTRATPGRSIRAGRGPRRVPAPGLGSPGRDPRRTRDGGARRERPREGPRHGASLAPTARSHARRRAPPRRGRVGPPSPGRAHRPRGRPGPGRPRPASSPREPRRRGRRVPPLRSTPFPAPSRPVGPPAGATRTPQRRGGPPARAGARRPARARPRRCPCAGRARPAPRARPVLRPAAIALGRRTGAPSRRRPTIRCSNRPSRARVDRGRRRPADRARRPPGHAAGAQHQHRALRREAAGAERRNAVLREQVVALGAPARIAKLAKRGGFVMPAADQVGYVRAHGGDARRAAATMIPPTGAPAAAEPVEDPAAEDPGALVPQDTAAIDPVTGEPLEPAPVDDPAAADPHAADPTAEDPTPVTRPPIRTRPTPGRRIRTPKVPTPASRSRASDVPLIDRRIALLLVLFIALLAVALMRAGWLAAVDGPELGQAADYQQAQQIPVLAQRGTITDRNGVDLAVSQPAMSVAATPYLVKDPLTVRQAPGPAAGRSRPRAARQAVRPGRGLRLPRAPGAAPAGRADPGHGDRGAAVHARDPARLPARPACEPDARNRRRRRHGAVGARGRARGAAARDRRRAAPGQRRARQADLAPGPQALGPGRVDPADARRAPAARGRGRAGRRRAPATRRSGRPRSSWSPRSGDVLALANWPPWTPRTRPAPTRASGQPRRRATYEPGSTFKAFTVAAALAGRRHHTQLDLRPGPDDPGRRPEHRRGARARLRDDAASGRSSPSRATSAP